MTERYFFDDGGVWSGDPNEPPVSCNPPCVHDTQQDGVEFDCTDPSRLPWLAAALNAAAQRAERDELLGLLRRARKCVYMSHPERISPQGTCEVAAFIRDVEEALNTTEGDGGNG